MRKISTLAFMAFFFCLSAMAQVELGNIKFSLADGKKINPNTGKITVTFPDVTGVDDPTSTTFVLEGSFKNFSGGDNIDFDGIEGSFATGVTFDLAEFELEPSTDYQLFINSVKVDGEERAAVGGYTLDFKTRGAERKMSWVFNIDDASMEQIVADAAANTDGDATHFIDITKGTDARYYVPARTNEEILLPDGTALPTTEDLTFKFGAKVFYVGAHTGNWADAICFNGNNQYMTIPDCQEGDVITFNANRSSKYSAGKTYTLIQAMNGAAIAPDGFVSESGVQDSIQLGSTFTNFKFEAQTSGDITFRFSNCILKSVTIEEAQEKLPRNYSVVAAYTTDEGTTTLKELVGKTEGITGSTVKVNYPYWLTDAEGIAYTHGTKGSPFEASFDLTNGEGDTTFVINYKKTAYTGVVYLSEGEDLEGAVLCTSPNSAIRSSMGKAGYVLEDLKLVTLQPGTYKIRAVLFDAGKTPSYVCTLGIGENEENDVYLSATATNWTETESDLLTITEPTDVTLKAGGSENTGVDVIMIYASEDAPEDPDGIADVKSAGQKAVRKVVRDGQILIETAAGTVNVAGLQVK